MEPLEPPQVDGLTGLMPLITAVGLTTPVVVPGADTQLATVTVTEYTPEAAVVAERTVGF